MMNNLFYGSTAKYSNCEQGKALVLPTKETVDYNHIYEFDSAYCTLNKMFHKYLHNRGGREDALEKHTVELVSGIVNEGGMDKFPAIIVDINTYQIADGNTRFEAAMRVLKDGKLPRLVIKVIFEDIPEGEFDERVIALNQGQKSWGLLDFIYNYSIRGNKNHERLISFCEQEEGLHDDKGKINPRYAAAALNISSAQLKKPTLIVTDEMVEDGKCVMKEARAIRSKFQADQRANGGGWYENFISAWAGYRPDLNKRHIDFNVYLKELKNCVENRKKLCPVPYGSNKKGEWLNFFSGVMRFAS